MRIRYRNPVIPGFNPDPSICRAGEDYYVVTSSFEFFPGLPVYHSRDLVNWRQVGHCLTRESQLPLEKARSSGGIYAPTIRRHGGTFYVVAQNVSGGGTFIVSAADPAGPWSEPLPVPDGGGDPSLFFDDDGTACWTCNGAGAIQQFEIDVRTGTRLSERRRLWAGTGGRHPEGAHLYKINGLYYLMIAEGGTAYGHYETIARSASPWGPFEPCPHNPILRHRDRAGHPIQGTGHADLVQAHDGSWWTVFLAFREVAGGHHHLGRETFLAPVTWTPDGWPVVQNNGYVELETETDGLPPHPWPAEPVRDDFDRGELRLCWNFLRNPRAADWSLAERPGWLRLKGSAVTLDDAGSPAFVGRRQAHLKCRVAALLDFAPNHDGEEAGLTVLASEKHHYELAVTRMAGQRVALVRRRIGDLAATVAIEDLADGPVELRIEADESKYSFSFAQAGGPPKSLATGETKFVSRNVVGGFTGLYFGMYATGRGRASSAPADFDWFDYAPEE